MNGPRVFPGPRIMMPHEGPPGWPAVAPPPPALDNTGKVYGIQARHTWTAGQTDERQVIDIPRGEFLWRISIFGRVRVRVDYGTKANRHLLNLLAPVVMGIPGQCTVRAVPLDSEGAEVDATLTLATGTAQAQARNVVDATLAAVPFELDAVRFVALSASTASISGLLVAVPALATVPLVAGSVLLTGSGFQEFEA
jgi:hypothetical protein